MIVFLIITTCLSTSLFSNNNQTSLSIINKKILESDDYVINFIKKINNAQKLISDMCESLEDKSTLLSGYTKPECRLNVSFINNTEIHVFNVNNNIRHFLILEKKDFCNSEKIECGEITILIKLIDLVNSAIDLTKVNKDLYNLILNLDLIDFDENFDFLKHSYYDNNILVNITLSKQKANIILAKEKKRIYEEMNKAYITYFSDSIYFWLGEPLRNTMLFTSVTISESIETLVPSLSLDIKIILVLVLFVLLKSKC